MDNKIELKFQGFAEFQRYRKDIINACESMIEHLSTVRFNFRTVRNVNVILTSDRWDNCRVNIVNGTIYIHVRPESSWDLDSMPTMLYWAIVQTETENKDHAANIMQMIKENWNGKYSDAPQQYRVVDRTIHERPASSLPDIDVEPVKIEKPIPIAHKKLAEEFRKAGTGAVAIPEGILLVEDDGETGRGVLSLKQALKFKEQWLLAPPVEII